MIKNHSIKQFHINSCRTTENTITQRANFDVEFRCGTQVDKRLLVVSRAHSQPLHQRITRHIDTGPAMVIYSSTNLILFCFLNRPRETLRRQKSSIFNNSIFLRNLELRLKKKKIPMCVAKINVSFQLDPVGPHCLR